MVEINGEHYCNAKEAAEYLRINRCMFYHNVKEWVRPYKLGTRRRQLYKITELEPFRSVQPVAGFVAPRVSGFRGPHAES